MAFHGFLEEFQDCLAIPALCDKAFQDPSFVIHSPAKIVHLAADLHEHLVQMPLPVRICAYLGDPFLADLCGKYRAKSVPSKSNGFVAYVDAAFVQKILNIPQRERKTHIHHHGQADDLGARLEATKGETFCHPERLGGRPARLNRFCSDSANSADRLELVRKGLLQMKILEALEKLTNTKRIARVNN